MTCSLNVLLKTQEHYYKKCHLPLTSFMPASESQEYGAHTGCVNNSSVIFRVAKKTPQKMGWFVTLWKRNADNITVPYDVKDAPGFFIIMVSQENQIGQFVFPQTILLDKKIISTNDEGGKRGIRIYSPWENLSSPQAIKTQQWQIEYFIPFDMQEEKIIEKIKKIYFIQ